MSAARLTLPSLQSVLPDLAAFVAGLACAWLLEWRTTDLVWSLWLSSLVIGYLSILAVIGKGFYIGSAVVLNGQFPSEYRFRAVLGGLALTLFLLGFFSLHFCGFHAVHAQFLSSFFPLQNVPKRAFGAAFMNPVLLWKDAFRHLVPHYGVFLLPVVVAERRALFGSVGALLHARRLFDPQQGLAPMLQASGASPHGLFSRPYVNVVRMHLLIFFFAICHALAIDSFAVYTVVYAVYFFPWSALRMPEAAVGAVR